MTIIHDRLYYYGHITQTQKLSCGDKTRISPLLYEKWRDRPHGNSEHVSR